MSKLWTSGEIAAATGGTASGEFSVSGVTFDSREVIGGELFIALRGESTDGHRFVGQARERGASGFLVGEPVEGAHVLVADTTAALEALGGASRRRSDATVIGVTGSVGKTSVKEALKLSLDRLAPGRTHASVKSYNNHTGVPLSLARMPADSRFGVFEMGMNHPGELAALTRMVRPQVAVVTWVASAHREFFATEELIADAKGEIFEGLEPGGTAIIPFDSPHRDRLLGHAGPHAANVLTFGEGEGADVRAKRYSLQPDCTTATADVAGELLTYKVGMAGRHWLNNSLAVLAAVKAAGGDLGLAGLALAGLTGLPGRGRRLRVNRGGGQAVVIDESYNANPASMNAALAVLGEVPPIGEGRRLAVLGSMKELGALSDEFHAGLAPAVEAAGVAHLVLVGQEIEPLAEALKRRLKVEHVADAAAAIQAAERALRADDVLLVKGSNSVGLGRLVAHFEGAEA
jgi:UDP-N-acetylmuramoyl-tripeptide--D-alanyl-D-alanine ligase